MGETKHFSEHHQKVMGFAMKNRAATSAVSVELSEMSAS